METDSSIGLHYFTKKYYIFLVNSNYNDAWHGLLVMRGVLYLP